jgi:hypothetical protein
MSMKKMNSGLRHAITTLMAGSALAVASGAAMAIPGSQVIVDLGSLKGQPTAIQFEGTAPNYAWDGWNGLTPNCGWAHNTRWYTVTVPYYATVQVTLISGDERLKPAFSMWKTNGSFVGANHLSHKYNQLSLEGSSSFLKPQTPGGDGAIAFVGYANAGDQPFINCDGQTVKKGTPTLSYVMPGTASFSRTLTKGQYLLAVGGSCNSQDCGPAGPTGVFPFKLDIRKGPILPLPVPPAP